MYRIALIIVLFVTSQIQAQTSYETGMNKAFELWSKGQITEASNLFERIANADKENWLPSYYAAQVLILDGFSKMKDAEKLKAQLDKAQGFLDDATTISKDNPEIMVMQALLHTVYVASDGATYGMTLSGKIMKLYADAYKLAPKNPRVVLNKAEWGIGSAKYFGQDTAPFCEEFKTALELFANFKPESEFHPNWGKDRAEEAIKETCKD